MSENRFNWSCMSMSFAKAFDITLEKLISMVGHDGGEKVWPELDDPYCRRGFHIDEMSKVGIKLGFAVTQFSFVPVIKSHKSNEPYLVPIDNDWLSDLIIKSRGVLMSNNHMVYCEGGKCYDPRGKEYLLIDSIKYNFRPHTFYLVSKI